MKDIQLVKLAPAIDQSLMDNPAFMNAMIEENWSQVANLVHKLVGRTLKVKPLSVDLLDGQLGWGGYYAVDTETRMVVGTCAFKGQPTDDGAVEIAYLTYPNFEGQGYATSMAAKLIKLAATSSQVSKVIAHTLPQANASTRVLEKVAMNFVDEVTDPEDGQVWQWQREV